MLKLQRLGLHARIGRDDLAHALQIPALGEMRMEVVEHPAGLHIEDLGADAPDVVVGRRQRAVVHETPQVVHQPPAVKGQQRPVPGRERFPGALEAMG